MMIVTSNLLLLFVAAGCSQSVYQYEHQQVSLKQAKLLHKSKDVNQSQIYTLTKLTDINHMNEVLDNILVPRVVGTPGHERVKKYIKSSLYNLGWTIETDTFEDNTPIFGRLQFENIIAKWNPNANRYLVLACHYDSKYEKNFEFYGATDSAVPCMQLINLATVMQEQLNTIKNNDVSLMLLFLDGEEAFRTWGPTDSIYGARNLAKKWQKTRFSYGNEDNLNHLDKIDIFVLLDLIGDSHPTFYNYFRETSKWFSLLSKIEDVLANLKVFENYYYGRPQNKYFQNYLVSAGIEDDHIPFLKRGVKILHLIPHPFPHFWHTADDNRSNIDMKTIENINKILRVFVASYLNMKVQEDVQSVEHLEL